MVLAFGAGLIRIITNCSPRGEDQSQNKYHSKNESLRGLLSSILCSYSILSRNVAVYLSVFYSHWFKSEKKRLLFPFG